MHKEGKIKRLQGRNAALQKSQVQLQQKIRKLSKSSVCQMEENRAIQHLKKDNKLLRRLSEQLSKKAKEHQQKVARLNKDNARLREENGHLRGMRVISLFYNMLL